MPVRFPVNLRGIAQRLDDLPVAIFVADRDRRIVVWNRRAADLTGYAAHDIVGHRRCSETLAHRNGSGRSVCSTDQCPVRRIFRRLPIDDSDPFVYLAHRRLSDRVRVLARVASLMDEAGEIIGCLQTFDVVGRADWHQLGTLHEQAAEIISAAIVPEGTGC